MDYNQMALEQGILSDLGQNGFMFGHRTASKTHADNLINKIKNLQKIRSETDDFDVASNIDFAIKQLQSLNPWKP